MPFVKEHSCRLINPKEFVRFFRKHVHDDKDIGDHKATNKPYDIIIGYREDDSSDVQANRYPTENWTSDEAKAHCKASKGIEFVPAQDNQDSSTEEVMSEKRSAIAVHHTSTSEAGWDGPKNIANLKLDGTEAYYKSAFAWQDPEADSKLKGSYKFIHHEVSADGDVGAANIRGSQSAIGVLNGARGGTDIPDGDRKGVWNHLAAHLKDADIEPAELNSMVQEIERRSFIAGEIRASGEGQLITISGHAALFNQLSEEIFGFQEEIAPGAFTNSLSSDDVRDLFNHDPNYVVGRTSNGTLKLNEDNQGLAYEVTPPDTQWARDLVISIRRGDISQMSFGFRTIRDAWRTEGEKFIRTLQEVKLYDISQVTFPAYPQTSATVRSAFEAFKSNQQGDQPGQEPEVVPEDVTDARAHLANLRRQLELAEKS